MAESSQTSSPDDNPALADVIERNIRTVARLHLAARAERGVSERIADAITTFSGRMSFAYFHVVWFVSGSWPTRGGWGSPGSTRFPTDS